MDPTIQAALSAAKDALVEAVNNAESDIVEAIKSIGASLRSVPDADWQSADLQAVEIDLQAVLSQQWSVVKQTIEVLLAIELAKLNPRRSGGSVINHATWRLPRQHASGVVAIQSGQSVPSSRRDQSGASKMTGGAFWGTPYAST